MTRSCATCRAGSFIAGDNLAVLAGVLGDRHFDLVSLDNPLGCFGEDRCEHFDILPQALCRLTERGALLFNVVTRPYGAAAPGFASWMARRQAYYGVAQPEEIAIGAFEAFYRALVEGLGYRVAHITSACREYYRGVPYLHMVYMELQRR